MLTHTPLVEVSYSLNMLFASPKWAKNELFKYLTFKGFAADPNAWQGEKYCSTEIQRIPSKINYVF